MSRPPVFFASVLFLSLLLSRPAMADPLAILASADGSVEVVSGKGGTPQRATFGRALEPGDRVRVGNPGSATVVFNNGRVVTLAAGSSILVDDRASESSGNGAPATVPNEVFSEVSKYVTGGSTQKGLVALSALRSGKSSVALPLIVTPRMTDVLTDRPGFRWRAVDGAQRYRVILSGEEGEVWTREVTSTALEFPKDADALEGGADYLWRLEAWSDRGRLREEESAFHVLDAGRRDAVRSQVERIAAGAGGPDSPATHFLTGSYLYASGLLSDAAAHFETLSRLAPGSPAPHEGLGNVYRSMGLMDLAAAEFEAALALTR
jgi:hypothetical protein